MIFDYYEMKNKRFDSYLNFLLACSHFTTEELEGTPVNRAYYRRLEQKAIKLMKLRKKDPTTNINQFFCNNRNINALNLIPYFILNERYKCRNIISNIINSV